MSALDGVVAAPTGKRLEKLGLLREFDVLLHLPIRYEDRTRILPLAELTNGAAGLVQGQVEIADIETRGRRAWLCRIADPTGYLCIRLFHYHPRQLSRFLPGATVRFYGEARSGPYGLEMVHPDFRFIEPDDTAPLDRHLTPIYPTADGIRQSTLRKLVRDAMSRFSGQLGLLDELSPAGMNYADLSFAEALRILHSPTPADTVLLPAARQRLAFEELLAHRLSLLRLRNEMRKHQAPALSLPAGFAEALEGTLPFGLTAAQRRVNREIEQDLRQTKPMMRLLQGDVGSGKTVVAVRAALTAIASGWQVAVMAPTELLAEQHHGSFSNALSHCEAEVVLLLGRHKGEQRRNTLQRIAEGRAGVIIGTHALFQQAVSFHRLGLVVIDEQHRFGVHQRLSLRTKGVVDDGAPHQLIMTATPIPRTLAMVGYADLDLSVIDEMPPGRTAVKTTVIPAGRREQIIDRTADWIAKGRQAYWVCTLIDESDVLQCEAAESTFALLAERLSGVRVALLHGRMKGNEKERVMAQFKSHEIDLLVSTTVIEVGVDVPNAGLMVIENAERFGLSQLHQLRGRVGRGPGEAYCVLLYQPPLGQTARQRLDVLRGSANGFEIAERDWELRGAGELLGIRQTGAGNFRVADLARDSGLLPRVAESAEYIARLETPIQLALIERWVGQSASFAEV